MDEYTDDDVIPVIKGDAPEYMAFVEQRKVVKKRRLNENGDDVHLRADMSVYAEIDVIKFVQQTFKHRYYKPGGKGYILAIDRLVKN